MRNRKKGWAAKFGVVIVVLLLLAGGILGYLVLQTGRFTYRETNRVLDNPKRGQYVQCATSDSYRLQQIEQEEGLRVVLLTLDLQDEKEREILSSDILKELSGALQDAQNAGFGVVFRAAYDGFTGDYQDPEFEIILAHIRQICPILNQYRGIMMGVQAGFLGPFGEWHSSKYTEFDEEGTAYRIQFLEVMTEELDKQIPIDVRRQRFIREAGQAGIDISRFGFHNDGLFGSDSDLGTYSEEGYDRDTELAWSKQMIETSFNGGEMPYVTEFSEISNAVKELRCLHISYLNKYYNTAVWEDWETQQYQGENGSDYIQKQLGYRLSLCEIRINRYLFGGSALRLRAELKNSGFSYVPSPCRSYLVLEQNGRRFEREISIGMIDHSDGEIMCSKIRIPKEFSLSKENSIRVGIRISLLEQDPQNEKYCVELANEGIIYENGCNWVGEYRNTELLTEFHSFG